MKDFTRTTLALLAPLTLASAVFAQATSGEGIAEIGHFVGSSSQALQNPLAARISASGAAEPGSVISIDLAGFTPDANARVYISESISEEGGELASAGILVGASLHSYVDIVVDADGNGTVEISIPADTPLGSSLYVQTVSSLGGPNQRASINAADIEIGITEAIEDVPTAVCGTCQVGGGGDLWNTSGLYTETTDLANNEFLDGALSLLVAAPSPGRAGGIDRFTVSTTGDYHQLLQLGPPLQFSAEFALDFDQAEDDDKPVILVPGVVTVHNNSLAVELDPLPPHSESPYSLEVFSFALDFIDQDRSRFAAASDGHLPIGLSYAQIQFVDVDTALTCAELLMSAALGSNSCSLPYFDPTLPDYASLITTENAVLFEISAGLFGSRTEMLSVMAAGGINPTIFEDNIIVSKLAAALGISRCYQGFSEAVKEVLGHDMQRLGQHIDNGQWRKAGRRLCNILDKLTSKRFAKALADKIGKKAAGKVLAQIGSKFVPVVGWTYLAGSAVWAIGEQYL